MFEGSELMVIVKITIDEHDYNVRGCKDPGIYMECLSYREMWRKRAGRKELAQAGAR